MIQSVPKESFWLQCGGWMGWGETQNQRCHFRDIWRTQAKDNGGLERSQGCVDGKKSTDLRNV